MGFAVDPPPDGGYPSQNTAEGEDALFSVDPAGDSDTAIGFQALYSNTNGSANTAVGNLALQNNTTGFSNNAIGNQALLGTTTGSYNVAIGENAMVANTTGGGNVAVGYTALQAHTAGFSNVAIGFDAMALGTAGSYNTAIGNVAMAFATGTDNTAVGDAAMNKNKGNGNIAIGQSAGLNFAGDDNVAVGRYAGQNVTTGANNILIGNQGTERDASLIRLGTLGTQRKTFIAGISGTTVSGGAAVMINSKGQLGVTTSSARYKEAIEPMKDASEAILSLKPVTFRYKKELDSEAIPQFGLVAEEVAKVDPDLVARDESGKPYTVRYEAVNAMLLNEFLKEHRKVEEQAQLNQRQEATIARLESALKEQAAQIQKVSARLEANRPAARVVSSGE